MLWETPRAFPISGALTLPNSLSDASKHRIKAATRDLIAACGGLDRSSEITGVGTSQLSRFQQASEMDCLISVTVALMLQADCGVPYVTSAMAALAGRTLSDPQVEAAIVAKADLMQRYADTTASALQMLATMAEAMADLDLTPNEAEKLDRVSGGFERVYSVWRQTLSSVKAGQVRA